MQEIELKILEVDEEKIQNKLKEIGATCFGTYFIKDKCFDFPDSTIRKADEIFRIRAIGERIELTYKDGRQIKDGIQFVEETELEIKNLDKMEKILEKIGLSVYMYREKIRIKYKKEGTNFDIDIHPDIPAYMEIEGTPESINQALKKLGYTKEDTTIKTATEVLASYGANTSKQIFDKETLVKRGLM